MESKILETLGIDVDILIIAMVILCVLMLVISIMLSVRVGKLTNRYNRFMLGKEAKSLEDSMGAAFSKLDKLIIANSDKTEEIKNIDNRLSGSFQKLGIVKYDAFKEMGGKLSFTLALLDEDNSGFVLNAMHSREACYTYIKEIIKGESYIALGDEEKEAVEKAKNKDE